MGKRCQVCDGPVVNGRCKYCGMPYRNDAVMYHLNEDRSEHYRHASEKVRKAMKENEIPLPDRTAKSNCKREKYFQKHGAKYSKEVSFICRTVPGSCRDKDRTYLYRKKHRLQRRNLRSLRKRAEYPRSSGWYLQAQLLYIPLYRIPWMWTV